MKIYTSNFFFHCKNVSSGCKLQFKQKRDLELHLKVCKTIEEAQLNPKIIQKMFGSDCEPHELALSRQFLINTPKNPNFIFYDIECVLTKENTFCGQSLKTFSHKLVSIAVNSFINNVHTQKVWVVENSTVEAEEQIVRHFLEFCLLESEKMEIDHDVENAILKINDLFNAKDFKDTTRSDLFAIRSYLKNFTKLNIFGFNSSKYDMNIIFHRLIKIYYRITNDLSEIHIIKKATNYFSVNIGRLWFKDLLNFTSPMSLDTYLRVWGDNTSKLTYPYEYFESIDQIRSCTRFPAIEHFYSDLTGAVNVDLYEKCKNIYEYHNNLPLTHIDHWPNFEAYLRFYNISDVLPSSLAMINQFKIFERNFGLNPIQSFGLPGFSRSIMYSHYDKTSSNFFTFPDCTDATKIFRDNIIGGWTGVTKRHVTLIDEPAAARAKFNKNGKKNNHKTKYFLQSFQVFAGKLSNFGM